MRGTSSLELRLTKDTFTKLKIVSLDAPAQSLEPNRASGAIPVGAHELPVLLLRSEECLYSGAAHGSDFPSIQTHPGDCSRPFGRSVATHIGDTPRLSGTLLRLARVRLLGTWEYMGQVEGVVSPGSAAALHFAQDEQLTADLALADQCRLNVLWFHGTWPRETALNLRTTAFDLGDALNAFCRRVEHRSESELDDGGTNSNRLDLPDQSFDLATIYGGAPSLVRLRELRRVLKSGACALIAVENRWWAGRWRHPARSEVGAASAAELGALALQAGFVEVSRYWAEPSLEKPRSLIPIASGRSRVFEEMQAREKGTDRLHAIALAIGMQQLLYPALLMIARA